MIFILPTKTKLFTKYIIIINIMLQF